MKKLSVLGVIMGAAVMCAPPVSLHWLPAQTPSLTADKANAGLGDSYLIAGDDIDVSQEKRQCWPLHRPWIVDHL
jgi:hypothetical protein